MIKTDCILCVDDKQESLLALEILLEGLNVNLIFASSGSEALKKCRHDAISLILMNAQMTDMDGFETAKLIKSNPKTWHIPIIFLSTINRDIAPILKEFEVGPVDYIAKPIDANILSSKINLLMTMGSQKNQLAEEIKLRMRSEHQADTYLEELRIANQEKLEVMTHNAITGLPNALLMDQYLQSAIKRLSSDQSIIGFIYIDVDNFNIFNECYGYKFSDSIIKDVSERIHLILNVEHRIFHYAIDEFVVMVQGMTDPNQLFDCAEMLRKYIRYPFFKAGDSLYLTVSIGISYYPDCGVNADELFKKSKIAMLEAKRKGKNKTRMHSLSRASATIENFDFLKEIRHGIIYNEFECYFQPKIDSSTNTVIGAEALIRWNHSSRGLIDPIEFIPFSEKNGVINKITDWLLLDLKNAAKTLAKELNHPISISFNLSPIELEYNDTEARVLKACQEISQLDIKVGVEMEITENIFLHDFDRVLNLITSLKACGCKVSIDDFGTGYSSFSYLMNLPVDYLKIDRSFVKNIQDEGKAYTVVKTITNLARELKLEIISEGVEEKSQLDILESLGCHIHQGYYYAKPMKIQNFIEFVNHWNAPRAS